MFKTKFICVGEIDLEILSELHSRHPGAWLDNEVVEPSAQQLHDYKGKDAGLICVVCFPKASIFFSSSFWFNYLPEFHSSRLSRWGPGKRHCSQLLLEFNELES